MQQDRNFDDMAQTFQRHIYGTTKGKIRQHLVWQDLERILARFPANKPLTILDAGGGQGQMACRLAALGHKVIVCDISEQMLQLAAQNAVEAGVELTLLHCPLQQVAQHLAQPCDLILLHAVLEWLAEPQAALATLTSLLRDGGILSLLYYNYHGLLFRTVTLGNFGYAGSGLAKRKKKTLSPDYPRRPDEVEPWLQQLALHVLWRTGIRVFHDYVVNKTRQQEGFAELLALEEQFCRQEPYLSLARYIHVVAQK